MVTFQATQLLSYTYIPRCAYVSSSYAILSKVDSKGTLSIPSQATLKFKVTQLCYAPRYAYISKDMVTFHLRSYSATFQDTLQLSIMSQARLTYVSRFTATSPFQNTFSQGRFHSLNQFLLSNTILC